MYNKIELYADNTDITLLQAALNDLLERNDSDGDKHGLSTTITALLTQLREIKENN